MKSVGIDVVDVWPGPNWQGFRYSYVRLESEKRKAAAEGGMLAVVKWIMTHVLITQSPEKKKLTPAEGGITLLLFTFYIIPFSFLY